MDRIHLRHVLYFFYQKQGEKKNAAEAAKEICDVYGDNAVTRKWAAEWFVRFNDPDFDISTGLGDQPRAGRPQELDSDDLNALLDDDSSLSTRKLAGLLGVDHSTIVRRLHTLGKRLVVGKWVPHNLTEMNKNVRFNVCVELRARNRR